MSGAAVAALTAGVGAATPLVSYLNQTLLRPSPFPDVHRLVYINDVAARSEITLAQTEIERLRKSNRLAAIGAYSSRGTWFPESGTEPVSWCVLDSDAFRALGVQPFFGRIYTDTDERTGEQVAVISYRLWRRVYHGDPAVLGTYVAKDSTTRYRIIGVMPQGFRFPVISSDVWTPVPKEEMGRPALRSLHVLARVRPYDTLQSAQAEVGTILSESGIVEKGAVSLMSLQEMFDATPRRAAPLIAIGALAALLLSAVVIWHLLWSDAITARSEIGVRLALGASRPRALAIFPFQAAFVSAAGAGAGVVLASYIARLEGLTALDPSATVVSNMDLSAIVVILACCMLIGVIAGTVPIAGYWSVDAARFLTSRPGPFRRFHGTGGLLTGTQVCGATLFAVCAGLTWASIVKLGQLSPGFEGDRLLTLSVRATKISSLPLPEMMRASGDYFEHILVGASKVPGVVAAAATSTLPIHGSFMMKIPFTVGYPQEGCEFALMRGVSDGYFKTLGLPLREGRMFGPSYGAELRVAIVNQTLASRCWPGQTAVGRVGRLGTNPLQVVGVVGDVPMFGVRKPAAPEVYVPISAFALPLMQVMLRVQGANPYQPYPTIRRLIMELDPEATVSQVRSIEDLMADAEAPLSVRARLFGVAAVLSLLIAAAGVFATAGLLARQRRRELAIRMALGASQVSLLVRSSLRAVGWSIPGLLAGAILAYWGASSLAPVLFGVRPFEPAIYGAAAGVLALVVGVATWFGSAQIFEPELLRFLHDE
jgi:predicted permease